MASNPAELLNAAIGVLHRLEEPTLCRAEKEKKLRAAMQGLDGEDGAFYETKVSEIVGSLLQQLERQALLFPSGSFYFRLY